MIAPGQFARLTATPRGAFSLLEIMAALTIATVATLLAITSLRPQTDLVGRAGCEATRVSLQAVADRFSQDQRDPLRRVDQLSRRGYWQGDVPNCPSTDQTLQVRSGQIVCPVHGS